MLLTIDVGNTNTVLGMFDGENLHRSFRVKTDPRATADEMYIMFRALLRGEPDIDGIALCSTVPAVLREIRWMITEYYPDVRAVIVEPGTRTGVPILTDNPKRSARTASSTRWQLTPSTAGRASWWTSGPLPTWMWCRPRESFSVVRWPWHRDLARCARVAGRCPAQGGTRRAAYGDRQEHR